MKDYLALVRENESLKVNFEIESAKSSKRIKQLVEAAAASGNFY